VKVCVARTRCGVGEGAGGKNWTRRRGWTHISLTFSSTLHCNVTQCTRTRAAACRALRAGHFQPTPCSGHKQQQRKRACRAARYRADDAHIAVAIKCLNSRDQLVIVAAVDQHLSNPGFNVGATQGLHVRMMRQARRQADEALHTKPTARHVAKSKT